MARTKKYDTQLEVLDEQIRKVQERLDKLIEQREEVIDKKKSEELSTLYNTLQHNNVTIEEAIELIASKIEEETE